MDFAVELGRRERKRQAVHQNLLEAAALLFRERGVARTTIDDIAEAADVARQTLFNHFPHKEALALELGALRVEQIGHQARALLECGVPAVDVMRRVASALVDCSREPGGVAIIVAQELLQPDAERARRASELVPLGRLFEAILEQAREEGDIREDLPVDRVAARLATILASMLVQSSVIEVGSMETELDICFDMFLNGISERRN